MSMPGQSFSARVSRPEKPSTDSQAKASTTPPNWASTPVIDSVVRRIRLRGPIETIR